MTKKMLYTKLDNLNEEVGGKFELDFACGGVRLCEIVNEAHGLSDVSERMNNTQMGAMLDTLYLLARKHKVKFNLS